jgi:hypothetical protein
MDKLLEELSKHFGYVTPFMYAAAAYGFFHWLDENASDEAKAALARTMRLKDYKNEQVASALIEVFDRIYTYPLLRWRAFFRSLLFTTVVSAIYLFEYYYNGGNFTLEDCLEVVGRERECSPVSSVAAVLGSWMLAFLFNVATDYLSLFVIRPLLIRSGTKPVIGLALGTASGVAITFVANWLRMVALGVLIHGPEPAQIAYLFFGIVDTIRFFPWSALGSDLFFVVPALAVFAWLPLFALGIVTARLLTPLSSIVGRTQWFLKEGKEHPLKAVGYVAAIVVFLGTVVGRVALSV